jgi:hypothetical protein
MGWIGFVCCEKFQRNFVARTCELIAPVQPILHQLLCSNKTVRNVPKYEFGVQWGASGAFVAKNFDVTSLHELVHYVHQFNMCCTEVRAVTKRSEMPQNMSLGNNGMDQVRPLRTYPS